MTGELFGFHVDRICRVRGTRTTPDNLIAPFADTFRSPDQDIVTDAEGLSVGVLTIPALVADAGALAILGEPGAGKTSVLTTLTAALPHLDADWDPDTDACLWVSGGDLTEHSYHDELGRHLDALPLAGETGTSTGILTIVLDQADESAYLRQLPRKLRKSLRTRDTTRARFMLACRTADYPAELTQVLAGAFGACRCVDLAPLSRGEAEQLADSAGVSGMDLIDAVEAASATVLASVPLTLEMLVRAYRADHQLCSSPLGLFERGIDLLAQEPHPDRISRPVASTVVQRVTVAGRIAARMLLSGHRTLWKGPPMQAGPFDLPIGDLAAGTEHIVAGSFEVTTQMLEETIATALFSHPDNNRVAIRHSSVTAYLAAKYLTDRVTTQKQLENLILVGVPDTHTANIPVPLQECAAWLVAMKPTSTTWLARADPQSLAVHSGLIRSDTIRALIVDGLLQQAAQLELGEMQWLLSRWDLKHPTLADQLAAVMQNAPAQGAPDWNSTARTRVAIRLAREAGLQNTGLTNALLSLAANDAWHQTERRLAASAAFLSEPERSAPALTQVLASLSFTDYAHSVDPDRELLGTLLELLWPQYLDTPTMLAALRNPPRHLYGMVAHFLREIPRRCPEQDLPLLLEWTKAAIDQARTPGEGFALTSDTAETSLLEAILGRALAPDGVDHLNDVAAIITQLFHNNRDAPLPDRLQPAPSGHESPATTTLRRNLAAALVHEAARTRVDSEQASWAITQDWRPTSSLRWDMLSHPEQPIRQSLLDANDFEWALDRTREAASTTDDSALVAGYGNLAARLFSWQDPRACELASNENHPAWPYLSPFFQAIPMDSPQARWQRRRGSTDHATRWAEADEFLAAQAQSLARARQGDDHALFVFLANLRIDPRTGQFAQLDGPMATWPGVTALDEELPDLPGLAIGYLTREHDHADTWIDNSGTHNARAWVGYALLSELHRVDQLAELTPPVWANWAAAILAEYLGTSTDYRDTTRTDLLRHTAISAPTTLATRIAQRLTATLAAGDLPAILDTIDLRWASELRTAAEQLLAQLSLTLQISEADTLESALITAGDQSTLEIPDTQQGRAAALGTWRALLLSLLNAHSPFALTIARQMIKSPGRRKLYVQSAALAANCLLVVDAETNWSAIQTAISRNRRFSKELALTCTQTDTEGVISRGLNEVQLVESYLWLCAIHPPNTDQLIPGARRLDDEDRIRRWRDQLIEDLSTRGTEECVHRLRILSAQYPDRLVIDAALIAATKRYVNDKWGQARTDDIVRVLRDPTRRIIRVSTDLLNITQEILETIDAEISPHGELLWDRTPGKRPRKKPSTTVGDTGAVPDAWQPKPEAALCAYLAHELTLRLSGYRVAVNREVLIQPTDPYGAGDRTDILIQALAVGGDTAYTATESVKLVIEVKGSWNPDLLAAQDTQLVARYLPEAGTDTGIYLVGWYPIDLWNPADYRRAAAKKHEPQPLLTELSHQGQELSKRTAFQLRQMLITIPRPHHSVSGPSNS
ncbi:NACHT domain-containing protein [Nocardia salmonicida]|uniref:NACHT domain-containing protein n=1 Tax=Nocardia salmonicida TaxID=53431 RepID=UPI00366D8A4A